MAFPSRAIVVVDAGLLELARLAALAAVDVAFTAVLHAVVTTGRYARFRVADSASAVCADGTFGSGRAWRTATTTIDRSFVTILDEISAGRVRADLLHADAALATVAKHARSVERAWGATRAAAIDVGLRLIAQPVAAASSIAESAAAATARAVGRD